MVQRLQGVVIGLALSFGLGLIAWAENDTQAVHKLSVGSFSRPDVRPLLGFAPVQFYYGFEPIGFWSPYFVAGTGILLSNIKSPETESHLNFNSQIGIGTRYAVTENVLLLMEYRYGHISNAGLNGSDHGIEMHNFLVGVSMKR